MNRLGPWTVLVGAFCIAGAVGCAPGATQVDAGGRGEVPEGSWLMTISRPDGTEIAALMALEADREEWSAHSRPGAAAEMLPWHRALLGRVLGKLPPHGALVNMRGRHSIARTGEVELVGRLESPFLGSHHFNGRFREGRIDGELRRDSAGAITGKVAGVLYPGERPVRDYAALAVDVRRAFDGHLFNPRLLERREWRSFFRSLKEDFSRATDDLDVISSFYRHEPRLQTSHIEFIRNPRIAGTSLDSLLLYSSADPRASLTLTFPTAEVAYLRVLRWSSMAPLVTEAFERIDSAGAKTLVLDIRGNPGGDISSMAPVAHLLADSTFAGVFLGHKWYSENDRRPTRDEISKYPVLSDANTPGSAVLEGVREHGVISGVIPPWTPQFRGEVYLLVDGGSGSASEPLAHLLKSTGRATLIGRRTAGAMLSAPPHPLRDGFVLVLPEADYYTADGVRLEGRGVRPHVESGSDGALVALAGLLQDRDPAAAAVLAGEGHFQARRWLAAEESYRRALRLDPALARAHFGIGRVLQERGAWAAAIPEFQKALLSAPEDVDPLYQIGRSAALSGEQLDLGDASLRAYLRRPHVPGTPSHAAAHWRLGMIHEARGDTDPAVRAYSTAVRLEPENADFAAALNRVGS